MKRSVVGAKEAGIDGVVLGVLTKEDRVDVERTRELTELARPLPVTYHRAFDEIADLHQALEEVIQSGGEKNPNVWRREKRARRSRDARRPYRSRGGTYRDCDGSRNQQRQYRGSCAANESARVSLWTERGSSLWQRRIQEV